MVELITEMLLYLALAAFLGLLLGYLFWGWGTAARISQARADGAASARTSVDGSAGLREQLADSEAECARQADEIERLLRRLAEEKPAFSEPVAEIDLSPQDPLPDAEPEVAQNETLDRFRAELGQSVEPVSEHTPEDTEDLPEDSGPRRPFFAARQSDAPETLPEVALESAERVTTVPRGLLSERPTEVDDLKKIKGVGKVMERVLNEKGIYLFHQLAALDAQEIAWVNDAIEAFPGRIQRDRWVEQARDLYEQKYGQPYDQFS